MRIRVRIGARVLMEAEGEGSVRIRPEVPLGLTLIANQNLTRVLVVTLS